MGRGRQQLATCEKCKSIHVQVQAFVCPTTNSIVSTDDALGFCEKCDGVNLIIPRQCTKAEISKAKKLRLAAIPKWLKTNIEEEIEAIE